MSISIEPFIRRDYHNWFICMGHVNRIGGKVTAVKIDGVLEMVTISDFTGMFVYRGNLGIEPFRQGIGHAMFKIGTTAICSPLACHPPVLSTPCVPVYGPDPPHNRHAA